MVDPPLAVEVGDNDPQGGVEQVTDQLMPELFEVVALNGIACPDPAVAEVGVIVMVTGVELLQPNSQMDRAAQNRISATTLGRNFIQHPFPDAVSCVEQFSSTPRLVGHRRFQN